MSWKKALTIPAGATNRQRYRNGKIYERMKEQLVNFTFEAPDGQLFVLKPDSDCYRRLIHCITELLPADCDADRELQKLCAELVHVLPGEIVSTIDRLCPSRGHKVEESMLTFDPYKIHDEGG